MAQQTTLPLRTETADDLATYILTIYRSYVESSAALSEYMLCSGKTGHSTSLSVVFRSFYRDFYRLYSTTRGLSQLKDSSDKTSIAKWFSNSRQVMDSVRYSRTEDRIKIFDYATEGLKLSQNWVDALYNKQIIRTAK